MNEEQNPGQNPQVTPPIPPLDPAARNAAMAQSVYPNPDSFKAAGPNPASLSQVQEENYNQAASASDELLSLILGVASSTSYLLITYFIKNGHITAVLAGLLAIGAIFFALRAYRRSDRMSPFTVIGLSSATSTLIYVGNILLAEAFIRSTLHY